MTTYDFTGCYAVIYAVTQPICEGASRSNPVYFFDYEKAKQWLVDNWRFYGEPDFERDIQTIYVDDDPTKIKVTLKEKLK